MATPTCSRSTRRPAGSCGRRAWTITSLRASPAGVKYHDGRVYVPISGSEEFNSGNKDYPCCTARGGVAALDASTGKELWKTYLVDQPKPWKKNPRTAHSCTDPQQAASGIHRPSILFAARLVGTGDAVTPPESPLTDAVRRVRSEDRQGAMVASRDWRTICSWVAATERTGARPCPSPMGPDYDIGNSPILVTLPDGKRALLVGTKGRGYRRARSRRQRRRCCSASTRAGLPVGFGGRRPRRRSCGAARPIRGRCTPAWAPQVSAPCNRPMAKRRGCSRRPVRGGRGVAALGAAPTAIPGVVFQGSGDGRLFAVSATDGKQLWEFNTAQDFETAKKVPGERWCDRHLRRGRRRRHGLHQIRICDRERRSGWQCPAGLWLE